MRHLLLLLVMLCLAASASAFGSVRMRIGALRTRSALSMTGQVQSLNGQEISTAVLRGLELTDYQGNSKMVGDLMGPDKSVVVFLRHLG
jgi:hypothetical protein